MHRQQHIQTQQKFFCWSIREPASTPIDSLGSFLINIKLDLSCSRIDVYEMGFLLEFTATAHVKVE